MENEKTIMIKLSEELHTKLKIIAAEQKVSMNSLIIELIENLLNPKTE